MKEVNRYTSNEFHDWQRTNLPGHFVMQDLDTWVLVWSDISKNHEPFALVELKRSFLKPAEWAPYKADLANYIALKKLADKASLPLWIIYFQKGIEINNNTQLKLINVGAISVDKIWMRTLNEKIIEAAEFKRLFPKIF